MIRPNLYTTVTEQLGGTATPTLDEVIQRTVQQVVARTQPQVQPMELRTFDELERWAKIAARSKMVPKDYLGSPDNIIMAVQFGSELGLRPMQSLQSIAVINGRPSIWGDAMLALAMTNPLYRGCRETLSGDGDDMVAECIATRQGDPPKVARFSVADAKQAGLWGKLGPWAGYPKRMLQMRARGFALRDAFPDTLRGLVSAEEASDYTLAAAGISGISAAPLAPPEPEAPADAAADWAALTVADFDAASTYEAVQELASNAKIGAAMAKLERTRPELFATVDAARQRAMDRTVEDAFPFDKPTEGAQ